MNFKWKDLVGLSALIFGLILSGVSLNKSKSTVSENSQERDFVSQPQKTQAAIKKKRLPQSENPQKEKNDAKEVAKKRPSPQNITKLIDCYHNEHCNYPNTDPREYKISVGQDIKRSLNLAHKRILRGEEKNIALWEKSAIVTLSLPDGHIKEAALEILSTQDPNPQAFEALLGEVINYHDPLLIAQALAELQKYRETKYQKRIYSALSQALKTGSLLVKKEIVYNIVPFLNKKSLPYFQSALNKMSPSSNIHTVLYKILKDYQTQQTGA